MKKMCAILQVSRSGYNKWRTSVPSATEVRRHEVKERILHHFYDNEQRYGSPKISRLLRFEGYSTSERTVAVYMRQMGLRSCVSKKHKVQTTDSCHPYPVAPNVVNQNFHVTQPNTVWVADITYIPCHGVRLYLASILDLCTKEIVGWRLGRRMTVDLVAGALQDAYEAKRPGKGLLHHSDRGSQYASHEYQEMLRSYGMTASMSRKGNCYDNACMESFHSILKKELIYCRKFRNVEQAYREIYRYIEFFYNRKRIHSSIGYLTPAQFAAHFGKVVS